MIYKTAVEQIKGAKAAESEMLLPVFRLGTVTNLSSGRAYIQFYGEQTASSKLYPYLEGYKPTVGDKVLILQQGSTYIIAGKISKDNVVDNYYMTKALVDAALNGYLTKAVADTLYEPLGGGGGGGDTDKIQNDTYYLGFSGSTSAVVIGNKKSGTTTAIDLGSTSYPFNAGYFKTLGGASSSNAVGTLNAKDVNLYGDIIPDTTNARTLGSSSKKFKNIYTEALQIGTIGASKWKPNESFSYSIDGSASSNGGTFRPSSSGYVHLGDASYKFGNGFFTTLGGDSSSNAVSNIYAAAMKMYGDIVPDATSNNRKLGSSSAKFHTLYCSNISGISTLGGSDQTNSIQTLNVRNTTQYGDTTPDTTNSRSLGTSSKLFKDVYATNLRGTNLYTGKAYLGSSSQYLEFYYTSARSAVQPSNNKVMDLGGSGTQFRNCYAQQFYQNGTAISTSDRRKKTGIKGIGKKYVDFFRKLRPKLFKFKDGDSGRLHSGFIAQDVEEAAVDCGIDSKDLAFLCIDENGNYGLRYDELIAIQTKVIQDLLGKVETLESRVEALEEIIKGGR